MSLLNRNRALFTALAVLFSLSATSAFATNPSPRNHSRMVFDERNGVAILFGGHGNVAGATGLTYDSNETWAWTGLRWQQRFPAHSPAARSGHVMVYDSKRERIVLFGGRGQKPSLDDNTPFLYFNDTWVWENNDWRKIETANAPSPRYFSGASYDRVRDRVILFGGSVATSDVDEDEPIYDTWEFDGTNWTRVAENEPKAAKPNLGYDILRNQTHLLGVNDKLETQMYIFDPAGKTWVKQTPEKLPPCVNEGSMAYLNWPRKLGLIYLGGLCTTDQSGAESVWLWDGARWIPYETPSTISRATGMATAFDTERNQLVMFGGQIIFSVIRSTTYLLDSNWRFDFTALKPDPRSLMVLQGDPVNNTVWMFGGLNEEGDGFSEDFWGYRKDSWFFVPGQDKSPANCGAPYAAFDSDRGRLLVSCVGQDLYEFDGTTWKNFDVKDKPDARRFAGMVYDENLKKTVIFGGYNGENYERDTWTWDGTRWAEVKPDNSRRPEHRGSFQMWYDGNLKKTVLYGGLGRPNLDSRITRFSDMWAFDGSGWTKLTPSTNPGERFGGAVARHPDTNKVILFGGLLVEKDGDVNKRQYFANDTWEWDGTNWTKVQLAEGSLIPNARQNAGFTFDPQSRQLLLYGGYNGFYLSDLWAYDPVAKKWTPREDMLVTKRRASGR